MKISIILLLEQRDIAAAVDARECLSRAFDCVDAHVNAIATVWLPGHAALLPGEIADGVRELFADIFKDITSAIPNKEFVVGVKVGGKSTVATGNCSASMKAVVAEYVSERLIDFLAALEKGLPPDIFSGGPRRETLLSRKLRMGPVSLVLAASGVALRDGRARLSGGCLLSECPFPPVNPAKYEPSENEVFSGVRLELPEVEDVPDAMESTIVRPPEEEEGDEVEILAIDGADVVPTEFESDMERSLSSGAAEPVPTALSDDEGTLLLSKEDFEDESFLMDNLDASIRSSHKGPISVDWSEAFGLIEPEKPKEAPMPAPQVAMRCAAACYPASEGSFGIVGGGSAAAYSGVAAAAGGAAFRQG